MQPLTDDELAILTSPSVEVAAGLDLLNADLTVRTDISSDLVGGSVEWGLNDDIHRGCSLQISRKLAWGVDLVRPWQRVTNTITGASLTRPVGVFALTTPLRNIGETPETYSVQGFDRVMLLRRQVGADYTVTAGTTYRAALLAVFAAAGLSGVLIDGSAADNTLPKTRVWLLVAVNQADPDQTSTPVTWLRIVNDLLRAINFRAVFCDETGVFRCTAYKAPADRAPEAIFDADSPNVTRPPVGEDRTLDEDVWDKPNRWVFRQTNRPDGAPAPTEGDGIYTHPTAGKLDDGRALTWTKVYDYEAADQAALVALGNRRVSLDLATTSTLEITTGPWPVAGHADVYTYLDAALAPSSRKVQAVAWSFDLTGSDVSWTWETV